MTEIEYVITKNNLVDKFIEFTPFVEREHQSDFVRLIHELTNTQFVSSVESESMIPPMYLSVEDTCRCFNLSRRCLVDRGWRRRNGFPTGNDMWGGKLSFSKVEVDEWMKNRCA